MTGQDELSEMDPSTSVIGVTGRLLIREAPRALAWIETKFLGHKVVVIGPPGVGKSSFIEFLRWGTPVRQGNAPPVTERTETAHRVFRIKVGKDSQLDFSISSIIDTAGHSGPASAAKEIHRLKPTVAILMLSATDPFERSESTSYSAEDWIDLFMEEASSEGDEKLDRLLLRMIIIQNKTDLVSKSDAKSSLSKIKPCVRKWTTSGKSARLLPKVPLLQLSLADGEEHSKQANIVVEEMAKALARNGRKAT